jgi:flagellar protein FliO/FliZ
MAVLYSRSLWAGVGKSDAGSATVMPVAGYMEAMIGLLLVIGLILVMAWGVKRMGLAPVSKGHVRIVGGVSLGTRERALILEVEGKRVLVGVAPGQVRPLMRLDDIASDPEEGEAADGFAQELETQLASRQGSESAGVPS